MNLRTWAAKWGVRLDAVVDLERSLGIAYNEVAPFLSEANRPGSEARVQSEVLLESASKGWRMWRNNVGSLVDDRGVPVRYGLCNDSKKLNDKFKSGDLIGIRPLLVTPELVGHTIGQFASLEVKEEGWQYTGQGREPGQLSWAQLVITNGGYAAFVNRKGLLP